MSTILWNNNNNKKYKILKMKQKDKIDILCEARLVNVCLTESARALLCLLRFY